MTNPTSNFGWQMPTTTDLVTDLPADFEVFGQAVDTSLADLKGGTTGQILAKASATDMDFSWITNDVGDITAVNVTAPITGGGTSGAVTIGVSAASTAAAGVVQLSDSTSTTSSVLASTPTATKSAYDLANGAIAKSTVTTAGDIIYRNATVPVRLGIGTAGQVLKVNSGATAPEWGTVSSGAVVQVKSAIYSTSTSNATSTFTDTGLSLSITPTSASNKILIMVSQSTATNNTVSVYENAMKLRINRDSTAIYNDGNDMWYLQVSGVASSGRFYQTMIFLDSPATTSAITYKTQQRIYGATVTCQPFSTPSTITLMEVTP